MQELYKNGHDRLAEEYGGFYNGIADTLAVFRKIPATTDLTKLKKGQDPTVLERELTLEQREGSEPEEPPRRPLRVVNSDQESE
ncbi:hypothetical protein N0V90_000614 [Kalmusia sp. IMI 367209]|nr:hypothetical protein N0V90_000614 [Kalmusia sp. IMI 367209]